MRSFSGPSRGFRRAFVSLLAALTVLLLLGASRGECYDHIQVHSLFPPILQHYWSNGMRYWAFGRNTVVTDEYVRLTDRTPTGKGYLWNRHQNRMEQFELNVTMQVSNKGEGWFQKQDHVSGIGIWYVNAQKVNYLSDASFFGFQKHFKGIGVVLDSSNELSVIVSVNDHTELSPESMRKQRAGSCTLPRHGELHLTISISYTEGQTLSVYYTVHENEEPEPEDLTSYALCTRVHEVSVPGTNHFGVTAANGPDSGLRHDVHSVFMTPLSNVSEHRREEAQAGNVRLLQQQMPVE